MPHRKRMIAVVEDDDSAPLYATGERVVPLPGICTSPFHRLSPGPCGEGPAGRWTGSFLKMRYASLSAQRQRLSCPCSCSRGPVNPFVKQVAEGAVAVIVPPAHSAAWCGDKRDEPGLMRKQGAVSRAWQERAALLVQIAVMEADLLPRQDQRYEEALESTYIGPGLHHS